MNTYLKITSYKKYIAMEEAVKVLNVWEISREWVGEMTFQNRAAGFTKVGLSICLIDFQDFSLPFDNHLNDLGIHCANCCKENTRMFKVFETDAMYNKTVLSVKKSRIFQGGANNICRLW